MKTIKAILNWLLFLGLIAAIVWGFRIQITLPSFDLPRMSGLQVIFFALSLAFVWVEILKWGVVKPFTCVKCMCGWFALILAFIFKTEHWYLYLPAGVMVGGLFEVIKMRYL